jgi:hypothetical protein
VAVQLTVSIKLELTSQPELLSQSLRHKTPTVLATARWCPGASHGHQRGHVTIWSFQSSQELNLPASCPGACVSGQHKGPNKSIFIVGGVDDYRQ